MSISSLFAGMEAYLDGDINYTDTVDDATIAKQTAEVASDTADATEEAKDTEVASQMLSRMCDMYDHVKQFGIDRTFVSLYNRHGELDRVCGIQFPSCESMDVVGDCYSQYSTAFIAAMESSGSGLWAKVKEIVSKIWNWIKNVASKIWEKIKSLFGFKKKRWQKIVDFLKRNKGKIAIGAGVAAAITAAIMWTKKAKAAQPVIKKVEEKVKKASETLKNNKESDPAKFEITEKELKDAEAELKGCLSKYRKVAEYVTGTNNILSGSLTPKHDYGNYIDVKLNSYNTFFLSSVISSYNYNRDEIIQATSSNLSSIKEQAAAIYSYAKMILDNPAADRASSKCRYLQSIMTACTHIYAALLKFSENGELLDTIAINKLKTIFPKLGGKKADDMSVTARQVEKDTYNKFDEDIKQEINANIGTPSWLL